MKRLLILTTCIAVIALVSLPVLAQPPGQPHGPRTRVPEDPEREGPPPHSTRVSPKFGHLDREYVKELREARKEIAELNAQLAESNERLRELWDKLKAAETPEAREALHPEFERVLNARSELELQVARRQVEIAQKGFDLALERLIEAKVALHEAQIKQERRHEWFKGDFRSRVREKRHTPYEMHQQRTEADEQPQPEEAPEEEAPAESEE